MSAATSTPDCHCGSPTCPVGAITAALYEFIDRGNPPADARILWCTAVGCRNFELTNPAEFRRLRDVAMCPDHGGPTDD